MPKSQVITSVARLCEWVEAECSGDAGTTVLYRGHGSTSFSLVPTVGRCKPSSKSVKKRVDERMMLELFRRQALDRIPLATNDDWELLAIAQHHGMATRFLDWTRNPLAALYIPASVKNVRHVIKVAGRSVMTPKSWCGGARRSISVLRRPPVDR
jgi:hypothetical protein